MFILNCCKGDRAVNFSKRKRFCFTPLKRRGTISSCFVDRRKEISTRDRDSRRIDCVRFVPVLLVFIEDKYKARERLDERDENRDWMEHAYGAVEI